MIKGVSTSKILRGVALGFLGILLAVGTVPNNAKALTISPVSMEIVAKPGETVQGTLIVLENEGAQPRTYTFSAEEFTAGDETGNPSFIADKSDIGGWITSDATVTLQPREQKEVSFTIKIPQNAAPGGHFAGLFWTASGSEGGQVAIEAKVGTLVFLTVEGQIVDRGTIAEFASKNAVNSTFPVDMFMRFQNMGNDRVSPKGTVTIKNMFGSQVGSASVNAEGGNVLPTQIRRFDVPVATNGAEPSSGFFDALQRQLAGPSIGRYTADVTVTYGSTNQALTAKTSFWMFPWQLLLVLIIVIVLIVLIVKMLRRKK